MRWSLSSSSGAGRRICRAATRIGRQVREDRAGAAELARHLGASEWPTASGSGSPTSRRVVRSVTSIALPRARLAALSSHVASYFARLDARASFTATRPEAQPVVTGRDPFPDGIRRCVRWP